MKKHNIYHWWITFTLICLGTTALFVTGLFGAVNAADVTKISFLIGLLFFYFTSRIGLCNYRLSKGEPTEEALDKHGGVVNQAWFASDLFLSLGMIGTVIGFIYMLSVSFGSISMANTTALRVALQTMGTGMSTALYTTAAGLVCSLLLKLQLYPISNYLDKLRGD